MRTLVNIAADRIEALAALCERVKRPRAAIAEYLAKRQTACMPRFLRSAPKIRNDITT